MNHQLNGAFTATAQTEQLQIPVLFRHATQLNGQVVVELKRPFNNGTTHVLFTPQDFLAWSAALVPRPRANLTRYHDVLAPNSRLPADRAASAEGS